MSGKLARQASLGTTSVNPNQRIKLLIEYGSQVEVDKSLALKLYFRSGREMLRMANMYCDDNQMESAFILYYKFITLFLEQLPKHPEYRSDHHDAVDFKRKVKKVFPIAEEIKLKLKKRYTEEEQVYLEYQHRLAEERAAEEERRRKALEEQERKDEELAKKLQEEEEAEVKHEQDEKYWRLRQQEEEKVKEEEERKKDGGHIPVPIPESQSGGMVLPGALGGMAAAGAGHAAIGAGATAESIRECAAGVIADSTSLPPPPSYSQYLSDIGTNPPQIPDRELKKNLTISDSRVPITNNAIPSVDRSKKPAVDHHMSLGEFGGMAGGQLRTVIVPAVLMSRFLAAAQTNTVREAETMGILCGKMAQGIFVITTLFIPQQKGGHDSCDMENEEELIYYQDEHNLITLGWIHTHPTQTAFLSSVDLHSHFPWQKMMPEAIAIVCSPKFQETGIFKLTDHGLQIIGNCTEKGFHPHSKEPPLFETCDHVQVSETNTVVVEDRRKHH